MVSVILKGVSPWDGSYDVGNLDFTNRELFEIKNICGVRAGELLEALDAYDAGAYVAVAVVAASRHGTKVDPNALWDAAVGSISLDFDDGESENPTPELT